MAHIVITGASAGTNDTALIQNALDAVGGAVGGGGTVTIVDGTWTLTATLEISSNTHLELGVSTVLTKDFNGITIVNKTGQNANIRLTGGLIRAEYQPPTPQRTGKHIAFRDVIVLGIENVRFGAVFMDWNTSIIDCEDVIVRGVIMAGGTDIFSDGLHFAGGKRITVSDCNIDCGDDALSLLNETIALDPVKKPLEDVVVTNCYLYSRLASAIKIQVDANNQAIRRVRISNVVAKTGGPTASGTSVIVQGTSTNLDLLTDVEIDGMLLDASQNAGPAAVVKNCRRVTLSRFQARLPHGGIEIATATDVSLLDVTVESPRTAGVQCVNAIGCTNLRIVGGRFKQALNQHAVFLQSIAGFEVSGALIEGKTGTSATLTGLWLDSATDGIGADNNIYNCSQWGINEVSLSTGNYFIGNRLYGNGSGGTGGALRMIGPASQAARNVAEATKLISDSGGFRQTIDGWSILTGATTLTEMDRYGGAPPTGRYRAARSGWITAIVIESTVSMTGGDVKVTVHQNSGIPDAFPGSATLATLTLPAGAGTKTSIIFARGVVPFSVRDELFLVFEKTGTPVSAILRCSFELEI